MTMTKTMLFAALALAGCATVPAPPPEPIVRTVEVKVVVPVPCKALADLGAEPVYPDSDKALQEQPSPFARVVLLLQGRVLRLARLAEYAAAKGSCQ